MVRLLSLYVPPIGACQPFTTLISTRTLRDVKSWGHRDQRLAAHKIEPTPLSTVFPALGGPFGWLLIGLSISVLAVSLERTRFWFLWRRRRTARQKQWQELLPEGRHAIQAWIDDQDLEMRFAQSFLELAAVLAPLLGLIGTVVGLSRILAAMGPDLVVPAGGNFHRFAEALLDTALGLTISMWSTITLHLNRVLRRSQLASWQKDLQRSGLAVVAR